MTYILAEIASAHMGDPDLCLELIHKAKEAGADGVKVQVWFPEEGDFSHMMDKAMTEDQHIYYLERAPRGFDLWGQWYGLSSKKLCDDYCDRQLNGTDKEGFVGKQNYPTQIADVDLYKLRSYDYWAYADHTDCSTYDSVWKHDWPFIIPAMAIAAGATLIEKHICLDREALKEKSKDYISALEPDEFKEFVEFIREAERAL